MASSYDPGTGILTLSGVASLADYETALEAIRFSSAGDNPVAGNRIIQVVVNDGIDDSQPATSLVTVVAVNDAPINTVPAAQTVDEDTTLPIAGVSVADSDSSALTTTLSVAHGILNVTAGPGVTFNGTASVTITGTAAQINTALAGLAYTGNLDFNGADTLTVATSDATATDTDTIAITVNPVNDAPINAVPGAQTVAEDTILPIAGVSVADIDSSALTTTLSVAHGILNVTAGAGVTGNGSASVTIAGTAAQINAALAGLAYTGNLDFNGADTLTVATSDATSTDTDTIAITVNPVNDTPVLNLDANSSTIGGVDYLTTFTGSAIAIVDTDVSILDTDSPSLVSATITLTNPHAGDSLTVDTPPLRAASRRASTIPSPGSSRSQAPRHAPTIRRRCSKSCSTPPILRPRPVSSTWSSTTGRPQAILRMRSSRSWNSTPMRPQSISTPRRSREQATTRRSPRAGRRSQLRTPIPSSAIPISAARSLQPPSG